MKIYKHFVNNFARCSSSTPASLNRIPSASLACAVLQFENSEILSATGMVLSCNVLKQNSDSVFCYDSTVSPVPTLCGQPTEKKWLLDTGNIASPNVLFQLRSPVSFAPILREGVLLCSRVGGIQRCSASIVSCVDLGTSGNQVFQNLHVGIEG